MTEEERAMTESFLDEHTIAEFHSVIQYYVNQAHRGSFNLSDYGEAITGDEVGFIRLKRQGDVWQVWNLVDDFRPVSVLPAYIGIENVIEFWKWLDMRLETATDRGHARGFEDGTAAFQRRLQDLCGINPNKFPTSPEST